MHFLHFDTNLFSKLCLKVLEIELFMQGTNPVMYNTSNWLKMGRENIICKQASNLLLESQDKVTCN